MFVGFVTNIRYASVFLIPGSTLPCPCQKRLVMTVKPKLILHHAFASGKQERFAFVFATTSPIGTSQNAFATFWDLKTLFCRSCQLYLFKSDLLLIMMMHTLIDFTISFAHTTRPWKSLNNHLLRI